MISNTNSSTFGKWTFVRVFERNLINFGSPTGHCGPRIYNRVQFVCHDLFSRAHLRNSRHLRFRNTSSTTSRPFSAHIDEQMRVLRVSLGSYLQHPLLPLGREQLLQIACSSVTREWRLRVLLLSRDPLVWRRSRKRGWRRGYGLDHGNHCASRITVCWRSRVCISCSYWA